ncbi:MAG: hypothetical protein ABL934_18430, partial [Lysobacteraceae bacterium]
MSLADLHRLKDAWEIEYPDQARGGETALRGFVFQFGQVLLDSVRAWLEADEDRRNDPLVYGEYLSDIAELKDSGVLLVTQVKFTQSSGMVSSALSDLYRVYLVAAAKTPELLPKLKLRILSARPELKNVAGSIARWQPQGVAVDDVQLAAFRSKVRTEIHADPHDELLALLANKLQAEAPLVQVGSWLGKLLDASREGRGYAGVARDVWNDLISLHVARTAKKRPSIYVWTAEDQPPQEIRKGSVLTGQQPQVHHLREGYFAPREAVSMSIARRVTDWAFSGQGFRDDSLRLPLYWIGGRSGAGKSVVLLQVLAHLHESGDFAILFPPSVAHLPAAIRWSSEVKRAGRRAIIALDDPYAPAAQGDADALWRDALDELHAVRQAGNISAIPLMLCCGPTEQADRLRDDLPDDINLTLETLGLECHDDFLKLRVWYEQRTGKKPPQVGDENVLLVQLFFEWRIGHTLPEFARRFRNRIEAADPTGAILEALARILALNRLYAGACRSAVEADLSPALMDVLDRFRAEEHLIDDAVHGRPGLWLSHPHLAEAVYASWFPASGANVRGGHLKAAIMGALKHGATPIEKTAPLWAVSRVLGPRAAGSDVSSRLAAPLACKVLSEVHAQLCGNGGGMPLSLLPVWIQVRRQVRELPLSPDPVEDAIARQDAAVGDEQGLRLTCHKLLEFASAQGDGKRTEVIAAVIRLLDRLPEWREWPAVAHHAVLCVDDPNLWSLVADWISRHIRSKSAHQLLLLALRVKSDDKRFSRIALSELPKAKLTEEWSQIGAMLLALADSSAREHLLRWIDSHRQEAGAAHLLKVLLDRREAQAREWALSWSRDWYLHVSADRVLIPLCAADAGADVVEYGCAWVEQRYERSGFMMQQLLNSASQNSTVQTLAFAWLNQNPATSGEWGHVWEALWKSNTGNDVLMALGTTWLREAPLQHGSWSFVWEALWKENPGDEALMALATTWLRQAPAEHGSWSFVWLALWKESSGDDALKVLGTTRLSEAPLLHGSWSFVWEALWKENPGDEALTALATMWLGEAPAEHVLWGFVWVALWKETSCDEALTALATTWLGEAPAEHGSWKYVWEKLWKETPGDEALTALATTWLGEAPAEHGSWKYVWEKLWKET